MAPDGAGGEDEPQLPGDVFALFEQLGGPQLLSQLRATMAGGGGPVNWELARRSALELAVEGDRSPDPAESARGEEAVRLAEHWLDGGSLPAPRDAGRLEVASRQTWVNAAIAGLRPLVEPVARAHVRALSDLVQGQLAAEEHRLDLGGLDLGGALGDLRTLLEPMGAVLMGVQAGQVIGQLSRQLLGQFDLGIPTADPAVAYQLAVNVAETFEGYGLDPTEVAVILALHEAAHRRQYHAVTWLAAHVHGLVSSFAAGTTIDAERLMEVTRDVMDDVDPEDPESLRAAMERAGSFRLEPTPAQRRVLERLQGVVCLLQAWARWEVRAAASGRLPNLARIEEVLRRRRATHGDGERQLADLLGLDLKPDDETSGDRFVATVHDVGGPAGLRGALAHPENLPDAEELAEPSRWLARMAGGEAVPDDLSALFDAPPGPPERGEGGQRRAEDGAGDRPDRAAGGGSAEGSGGHPGEGVDGDQEGPGGGDPPPGGNP